MAESREETLVERLLAVDAELQTEFSHVSEPDDDVWREKKRLRYMAIVKAWLREIGASS